SLATCLPLSSCTSKIVAFPPFSTSFRTVASPNPEAPPVTTADTFFTSIFSNSFIIYFQNDSQFALNKSSSYELIQREAGAHLVNTIQSSNSLLLKGYCELG